MSCPICYTDDADMVVCWNEHGLCETCYRECLKPRVRNDEIAGVDKYHVNNKCPTCREPMFDWYNLVVENMNNTMIAPVRRRRQGRGRRCGFCGEYGHHSRTCPTRQEQERQQRQEQYRQERQRQERQVDNHNERAISIRMRTLEERIRTILTDLQANVRDPLPQAQQPQAQQPQAQQPQAQPQAQQVRQRRTCRCGICGNTGHNRRTCPTIRT